MPPGGPDPVDRDPVGAGLTLPSRAIRPSASARFYEIRAETPTGSPGATSSAPTAQPRHPMLALGRALVPHLVESGSHAGSRSSRFSTRCGTGARSRHAPSCWRGEGAAPRLAPFSSERGQAEGAAPSPTHGTPVAARRQPSSSVPPARSSAGRPHCSSWVMSLSTTGSVTFPQARRPSGSRQATIPRPGVPSRSCRTV